MKQYLSLRRTTGPEAMLPRRASAGVTRGSAATQCRASSGAIVREVLTKADRVKADMTDDRWFYDFPRLVKVLRGAALAVPSRRTRSWYRPVQTALPQKTILAHPPFFRLSLQHVDDNFLAQVTQLYRERIPAGATPLASWRTRARHGKPVRSLWRRCCC